MIARFKRPRSKTFCSPASPAVDSLNDNVLRLPVRPSRGNFYEAGFSKRLFSKTRLDVSHFRRTMSHFADDDLLLNTAVSFPNSRAGPGHRLPSPSSGPEGRSAGLAAVGTESPFLFLENAADRRTLVIRRIDPEVVMLAGLSGSAARRVFTYRAIRLTKPTQQRISIRSSSHQSLRSGQCYVFRDSGDGRTRHFPCSVSGTSRRGRCALERHRFKFQPVGGRPPRPHTGLSNTGEV